MKVLFGYAGNMRTIGAVIWQDDDGIHEKSLLSDGSTRTQTLNFETLQDVKQKLGRSMYPLYPAEVDDIRSAFKYLGKASDLVELLPEANLDEQPDIATA